MANKKKITTAVVAGVTAAALALGGTFAWTSFQQEALNESAGIVNVGGRLHDDFNGTNKDIYVENFTDPLNGGQPIYARIRLDEYMEVGSEAGKYDAESNTYVADRNAQSVVSDAVIDNVSTWTTHVPTESCTVCATSDTCAIHDHWEWTMGNTEAKYFMPTFNKDKDSLDADINGTYHGIDDTDKVYYDDYVVYEANQTVTENAYYDDDTDTAPNTIDGQYKLVNETHTAKLTGTATVITMEEWLDENGAYAGAPGPYWVYDTDGWAYWAQPIMPGESTGFLLDGINMYQNPGEKCYYAINVVAQFATVSDWEYFENKDGTLGLAEDSNALKVMEAASNAVPSVTVTNVSGIANFELTQSYTFSASASIGGATTFTDSVTDFTWSVLNKEGKVHATESDANATGTKIVDNGDGTATLTVGGDEYEDALVIVAVVDSAQYAGAVGMSSATVDAGAPEWLKQVAAGKIVVNIEMDPDASDAEYKKFSWNVLSNDTENSRALLALNYGISYDHANSPRPEVYSYDAETIQTALQKYEDDYDMIMNYAIPYQEVKEHNPFMVNGEEVQSGEMFLISLGDALELNNSDSTYRRSAIYFTTLENFDPATFDGSGADNNIQQYCDIDLSFVGLINYAQLAKHINEQWVYNTDTSKYIMTRSIIEKDDEEYVVLFRKCEKATVDIIALKIDDYLKANLEVILKPAVWVDYSSAVEAQIEVTAVSENNMVEDGMSFNGTFTEGVTPEADITWGVKTKVYNQIGITIDPSTGVLSVDSTQVGLGTEFNVTASVFDPESGVVDQYGEITLKLGDSLDGSEVTKVPMNVTATLTQTVDGTEQVVEEVKPGGSYNVTFAAADGSALPVDFYAAIDKTVEGGTTVATGTKLTYGSGAYTLAVADDQEAGTLTIKLTSQYATIDPITITIVESTDTTV